MQLHASTILYKNMVNILGFEITRKQKEQQNTEYERRAMIYDQNASTIERSISGYKFNTKKLYTAYNFNVDVQACVREWKENAFSAGYTWADKNNESIENDSISNGLDEILNYKTPTNQSANDLLSGTIEDYAITGNAYWYLLRNVTGSKVLGIKQIDPRGMSILYDKYGTILMYLNNIRDMEYEAFLPEEIIHFKRGKDKDFTMFGETPMKGILFDTATDYHSQVTNLAFFENGGQPAGVIMFDDALDLESEEGKIRFEKFKTSFKGSKNRGKMAFSKGIKDIKTFTITHKEMQFIEGRKYSTGQVCKAYGISPFAFGVTEKVNNNNGVELSAHDYFNTIIPLENKIAETISRNLPTRLGLREGEIKMQANPQKRFIQLLMEKYMQEYEKGILTLRQYKAKTAQKITPEDEANPNIDKHIILSGGGAILSESIGQIQNETVTA